MKSFLFCKHNTSLCLVCNFEDEVVIGMKMKWWKNLHIPLLSSHSAILSLMAADEKVFLILNHLLLLSKHYIFVSSSSKVISFETLTKSIMKVYRLEKTLSQSDEKKRKLCTEKWKTILQNLWNMKIRWAIPLNHYSLLLTSLMFDWLH